jgi:hypothetical protein
MAERPSTNWRPKPVGTRVLIQVVAFFAPPDPAGLQALEEAGADAALIALEIAGEQEALAKLEEIAQQVLP